MSDYGFELIKKGAKVPTPMEIVDVEICNHLNDLVDGKDWCRDWMLYIGGAISSDDKYQLGTYALREKIQKIDRPYILMPSVLLLPVLKYLEDNYISRRVDRGINK